MRKGDFMFNLRKIIAVSIILYSLFTSAVTNAEITTYEGVGKCIMSDFESDDIVKLRAKTRAEQNAKEKAGVYIKN